MSIGAVSSNPWANPYLYTGSSSSNGSSGTTGTDTMSEFTLATSQAAGATSQAAGATAAGTSTTSGSTLGLGSLLSDFQNWLLQMQMQSGTAGSATAASATSGTTSASGTGTSGTGSDCNSETASASGTNGQHGDQRNQAMSLLRNIDTELTSINSELQGTGTASQAG